MVADFVFHDLAEQEGQQLLVILRFGKVLLEALFAWCVSSYRRSRSNSKPYPLELLLDGQLLGANKAADGDLDGQIDIVASYRGSQMHLCARFSHTDRRFEVSNGDWERTGR